MIAPEEVKDVVPSDNPYLQALLNSIAYVPGTTITYVLQGLGTETLPYGGSLWSEHGRRDAFNSAIQSWANVTNINFVESDTAYNGSGNSAPFDWIESFESLSDGVLGMHATPAAVRMDGTFTTKDAVFAGNSVIAGGQGYSTFVHEIGHGLGLLHPHPEGEGGDWDVAFPGVSSDFDMGFLGLNQGIFTVMSYNPGYAEVGISPDYSFGYEMGPGAFDIAAIQHLYGANMEYHSGNDSYVLPDKNAPGTGWLTIWDAGGVDTLTAGNTTLSSILDLREATLLKEFGGGGFVSRIGGVLGGFTIANGVVIENATGGSGDDLLFGNSADNVLNGGGGFDTVDYSHLSTSIVATLGGLAVSADGTDTLTSIEGLIGGSGDDTLTAADQTSVYRQADFVVSAETSGGTYVGNAFELADHFSVRSASEVGVPNPSESHLVATVTATGRDEMDYYTFTLGADAAGSTLIIDIDNTFDLDASIKLLYASGDELNANDDGEQQFDIGSANPSDSYLTFTLPAYIPPDGRTFVIQVGSFAPEGLTGISTSSSYTMHVVAVAAAPDSQAAPNSSIDGGAGDDLITGMSGRDLLIGGLGEDRISGNGGDDQIFGGLNNDILDGGAGNDLIDGGDGADILDGGLGNDILEGGGGKDTLTASAGADILKGGSDDDLYILTGADGLDDIVVELEDGGLDTILVDRTTVLNQNYDNVERATLTDGSGALNLTGNALDNVLTGNNAVNELWGLDGDDVLFSGAGDDRLVGGTGSDTYYVEGNSDLVFESAGEGYDTVHSIGSFYLFANLERLVLTGDSSTFGVGNELDNWMLGNGSDNLLIAEGGNDTVIGGAGADLLFGESGADTVYGGDGLDYLVGASGNDSLFGNLGPDALYGGAGDDVLAGDNQTGSHYWSGLLDPYGGASLPRYIPDFATDILVAGEGNDTLYGNSGLGDYDLLYGNEGDDTYYVDTPDDLVFEQAGEGYDIVHADIDGAGFYLYANIEELILEETTPFGVGNELDNRLIGSWSENWLLGGAGDDFIHGGRGADVLFGEAGSDTFYFEIEEGTDVIGDFTQGEDLIDLSALGYESFAEVQSLFTQDGSVGAIIFNQWHFIVLHDVVMTDLTAEDFIL